MAFLKAEYKVLSVFVVIVAILLVLQSRGSASNVTENRRRWPDNKDDQPAAEPQTWA